jgi:hypothetical protein
MKKTNKNSDKPFVKISLTMEDHPSKFWQAILFGMKEIKEGQEFLKTLISDIETNDNLGLQDDNQELMHRAMFVKFSVGRNNQTLNHMIDALSCKLYHKHEEEDHSPLPDHYKYHNQN